jgi:glutamate carboxypeptidase
VTRAAELRRFVHASTGAMLEDLEHFVRIETPSDDRPSLDAGADWVRQWMDRRLGPPESYRREPGGPHGDTLIVEHAGSGAGTSAEPVCILGHYDTVWPVGTLESMPFDRTGDVLRGPGVFDMKAGLVQAVWALRALDQTGCPRPPVRWVINGDEEIGSPASRRHIEEQCRDAGAVLVFEPSADGAVKTARKGIGTFDVTLTGAEAHAGLDPRAGASAISALAELIQAAHGLADLDSGTSVNVGLVSGGSRHNVTAGSASAGIDVRVATAAEADRIDAALSAWRPSDPRVAVRLEGGWTRPVMARSAGIARLFEQAADIASGLGFGLGETAVGGASDGNFAAALGRPVLDGLGAVGGGAHSRQEHATVSGLTERTVLAAVLISALAAVEEPGPRPLVRR